MKRLFTFALVALSLASGAGAQMFTPAGQFAASLAMQITIGSMHETCLGSVTGKVPVGGALAKLSFITFDPPTSNCPTPPQAISLPWQVIPESLGTPPVAYFESAFLVGTAICPNMMSTADVISGGPNPGIWFVLDTTQGTCSVNMTLVTAPAETIIPGPTARKP